MPRKLLFLMCVTLLGWASLASANGRYPRSMKLIIDPTDPEHLVISGTFGLATSRDGGQSWAYICEASFSDPNTITDPLIAFTNDGTLYTGTQLDLRRSDPELCEFDIVLGEGDELVPDHTIDVDGQSLLAVVSKVVDGKDQATVQASPDGDSWEPLGAPIEDRTVLTLDVAPSDGQRLYITAHAPEPDVGGEEVGRRGVLLVSRDRGESFEELDIPGTSWTDLPSLPYIAAVHPTDPDVLYVRLSAQKQGDDGLPWADDSLLVSRDAGETFVELIRKPAALLGFGLSPDAKTVMVGFGKPDDKTIVDQSPAYGFYRITGDAITGDSDSNAIDVEFIEDSSQVPAYCVTWTKDGVYICVRGFAQGTYEVGFMNNPDFSRLDEAKKLLYLADFEGPAACPSGSEAAVCATRWDIDCERLVACDRTTAGADGGVAASGGAAGQATAEEGGAAQGASGGAAGSSGGSPSQAGEAGDAEEPKSSSCGCRFVGANRFWASGGVLACLAFGWILRSRRRRRQRNAKGSLGGARHSDDVRE